MKKNVLLGFTLISTVFAAHAEIAEVNPLRHTGGIARDKNNRLFPPSTAPLHLPMKSDLSMHDRRINSEAEQLISNNKTTAILLIERGKIVFERYKNPAKQDSALYSQSMSKSLTAYTIGNLLCDGKIKSSNDPAREYIPELAGTAQGDASIKHLLSMSSGGTDAITSGEHEIGQTEKIRKGDLTIKEVIVKNGSKNTEPGKQLRYSALDTFTLAQVANATGGFFESFEKYVWQAAGTESPGYWLFDRNGDAMAASGISATGRDWARLAIFSIQQTKATGCIGEFMRSATSAQVPNITGRVGKAFPNYGYQTWIGGFKGKASYWWLGYGGQRVGIDPVSERIIVITSWREDYMADVYKLWSNWNN